MNTTVPVTLELPANVFMELQTLAHSEHTDVATLITRIVLQNREHDTANPLSIDPVVRLMGAYSSQLPLVDDIPVSEDPDLYLYSSSIG